MRVMHIPDGLLSNNINIAAAAVSGGLFYYFNGRLAKTEDDGRLNIAGALTAFVFAAQMINFPIGFGASGHFLGALFLMLALGAPLGFIAMSVILVIQALFFADGGITALGSNIFNMGVMGGLLPYLIFVKLHKTAAFFRTRAGFPALAAACAYISVILASFACGVEIGLSGVAAVNTVLATIVFIHAFIAAGEAALVFMILNFLAAVRPELFAGYFSADEKLCYSEESK